MIGSYLETNNEKRGKYVLFFVVVDRSGLVISDANSVAIFTEFLSCVPGECLSWIDVSGGLP